MLEKDSALMGRNDESQGICVIRYWMASAAISTLQRALMPRNDFRLMARCMQPVVPHEGDAARCRIGA